MSDHIKLIERLKIQLQGHISVGHEQRNGWKEPVEFYRFKCPVHGYVKNYVKGHDKRLECPECHMEKKENLSDDIQLEISV
jgi:hypothetical protein